MFLCPLFRAKCQAASADPLDILPRQAGGKGLGQVAKATQLAAPGYFLFRPMPFGGTFRKVGMQRIHNQPAQRGSHNKIHIFHRNSAQENLVSENHSADVAFPVLESDANRPDVIAECPLSVGSGHGLLRCGLQLELNLYRLRDTQIKGPRIGKCLG